MERTNFKNDDLLHFLIQETYDTDSYISVNKSAIKLLGLIPAVLLGNFISKSKYFAKINPENKGWFYLTHAQQMEELNLPENSVIRGKQQLINLNLLEKKKIGMPSKEFLRVNMVAIVKLIKEHLVNDEDARLGRPRGFGGSRPRSISGSDKYNNIINNIININNNKNKQHAHTRVEDFLVFSKQLSKCIQSNKKINHTQSQINSWAKEISKLHTSAGISKERIQAALKWYEKNIGSKYVPVIESGVSFREKFIKLECAMERDTLNATPTKQKYTPTYFEETELDDKFKKRR